MKTLRNNMRLSRFSATNYRLDGRQLRGKCADHLEGLIYLKNDASGMIGSIIIMTVWEYI